MRVALVGTGVVAALHGLAVRATPRSTLAVVAAATTDAAAGLAEQLGARPGTVDQLPAGCDLVVLATPAEDHLELATRCVDAGAAVLVDAPLATTLADADALVDLAGRGYVAYGEAGVHAPAVAAAIPHARDMAPVTYVETRVFEPPEAGAGGAGSIPALLALGSRAVALTLVLAGTDRVVEVASASSGRAGADERGDIRLRFASGAQGRIEIGRRPGPPGHDAQVATASGALRVELAPESSVERDGDPLPVPRAGRTTAAPALYDLGYVAQLHAVVADVEAGTPPLSGAAFGRAVLDLLCAASEAARRGVPEPVPFGGRRDRPPPGLGGVA